MKTTICPKPKKKKRHTRKINVLKTATYFYYALGNGIKRIFTNKDRLPGYGKKIPDPKKISFTNVFVDGLLQSPWSYKVSTGKLRFVTTRVPVKNARVIAEFVSIKK